jgi:hypothetical protein
VHQVHTWFREIFINQSHQKDDDQVHCLRRRWSSPQLPPAPDSRYLANQSRNADLSFSEHSIASAGCTCTFIVPNQTLRSYPPNSLTCARSSSWRSRHNSKQAQMAASMKVFALLLICVGAALGKWLCSWLSRDQTALTSCCAHPVAAIWC